MNAIIPMTPPDLLKTKTTPICPFCNKEIFSVERVKTKASILKGACYLYLCGNCKKVLSVGGIYG